MICPRTRVSIRMIQDCIIEPLISLTGITDTFYMFGFFYEDELHLCLVLGKRARAKLVHVDWSGVKVCPGVVDWIDHTSLNGRNMWGIMAADEEIFASKEV